MTRGYQQKFFFKVNYSFNVCQSH